MPRPRLELGTWGKISRTEMSPGRWRARARFRDFTGHTRQVEAYGATGAKAERALERNLRRRVQSAGVNLTGDTTVKTLAAAWLAQLGESDDHAAQTIDKYTQTVDTHVLPALGEYRLIEATVSRVDGMLRELAKTKPGAAQSTRAVLNGMFMLAVRHDALRSNPVKEVRLPNRARKPVKALTVDEWASLRKGLAAWQAAESVSGTPRGTVLLDVADMMMGTGVRIGEALALRWEDVDLAAALPTVTVSGTLVNVKGEGLRRQAHTKTAAGYRVLTLPRFVVEVLLRRSIEAVPTVTNAVFPTGRGSWMWPNNYRRKLRAALRDVERAGSITPHVFRRSVATLVDAQATLDDAAAVLGHAGTGVTAGYYVAKPAQAPDASGILQAFGGDVNENGG